MAITVPPVDNPSNETPLKADDDSGVGSSSENPRELPAQVKECFSQANRYFTMAVEDVVKPSFKTFMEIYNTNPHVAAIVANPALRIFLVVLGFFVLSTLVLVLCQTILIITIGVFFIIIGGLVTLFFKFLMVFLAVIPVAGIAAALFAGANVASQFIFKNASQLPLGRAISNTGIPRAVKETDWKQIAEKVVTVTAQAVREITPVVLTIVRDVGLALHSGLQTSLAALHQPEGATGTSTTGPVHQEHPGMPEAHSKKVDGDDSPIIIDRELDTGAVSSSAESSAEGLKRRAPFPNVGGEETD